MICQHPGCTVQMRAPNHKMCSVHRRFHGRKHWTERVYSRRCPQCEDMSWRRPEDGSLCRCGKAYAPYVIEPPTLIGSTMAFDNVGETGRKRPSLWL